MVSDASIGVASSRERLLRSQFNLPAESSGPLPVFYLCGDFSSSDEARLVKHSFDQALNNESPLPSEIREIVGMSGQKYRAFINNLVRSCPNPRYLEVGSWAGSTATAALSGNCASALCIDNWSGFGGPKDQFFQNINNVLSEKIQFKFMECDFRSVDYGSIGKFNIYLFDGPHKPADQYDAIVIAHPALTETFFLIVDDWNWLGVRLGTLRALAGCRCQLECSIEVRTTLDGSYPSPHMQQSDWHNGYFIAVVRKERAGTETTTQPSNSDVQAELVADELCAQIEQLTNSLASARAEAATLRAELEAASRPRARR
jgi:hypothetical protein